MRRGIHDYFIWYCDWCDSKHLVPRMLQHEARHFCPACSRQAGGVRINHEFTGVCPA